MKQVYYFSLLLFFFFITLSLQLQSQSCPQPSNECSGAFTTCYPFSTRLSPGPGSPVAFPGCPANVLDNPVWYQFELLTAGVVDISISQSNCANSSGMQSGLYTGCLPSDPALSQQCGCTTGIMTHSAFLNPGTYYILLDGCAGDLCDHTIDIFGDIKRTNEINIFSPITTSDKEVCPFEEVTFFTGRYTGASDIRWDFPDGVVPISGPPYCESVTVIWSNQSDYITFNLSNGCGESVDADSFFVEVATLKGEDYGIDCKNSTDSPGWFHQGSGLYVPITLPGEPYQVTLQTVDGCDSIVDITVVDITEADFSISKEQSGCDTGRDRLIIIARDQSNIQYEWQTNNGNIEGSNLSNRIGVTTPGIYSLTSTIVDSLGDTLCSTVRDVEVLAGDFVRPTITVSTMSVSCFEGDDGVAEVSINGGFGPFTVKWSANDSITTSQLQGLSAGNYSLTVFDEKGCDQMFNFVIDQPDELFIEFDNSNMVCQQAVSTTAIVSGGTAPYLYSWSTGENTAEVDGLEVGVYFLTVTDSNGCGIVDSVMISGVIDFDINVTPVQCDSTGGKAVVSNVTGTTNYDIEWSTGQTTDSITNLVNGGYSVTITDINTGCRRHKNAIVSVDTNCFVLISGYVYDDQENSDCVIDQSSEPVKNAQVEINIGTIAFTNSDGYYEFEVRPGEYTLQINIDTSNTDAICADPIVVDARTWGIPFENNDFFIKRNIEVDLFMKISKRTARPGRQNSFRICVMNRGRDLASGTLFYTFDSLQTYISSFPSADNFDSNNRLLSWDFTDLAPGSVYVYNITLITSTTAQLDDIIRHQVEVVSNDLELNPSDNVEDCIQLVRTSYDPNDKQVSPMGRGAEGIVSPSDSILTYLVRFQNTGNDTAFTVVIRDEIDRDLRIRTLQPVAASHEYSACILPEGILEFTFDNILLPDSSTNLAGSQGFVFFEIEFETALPPGTQITNSANIYFDYNAPILTNTVLNTIGAEDVVTSQTIQGCGSVAYNGVLYTADTLVMEDYELTYNDSTVNTTINVLPTYETVIDTTISQGEIYQGITINVDTVLTEILTASNGCDSTITTNVTVMTTSINGFDSNFKVTVMPNPFQQFTVFDIVGKQPGELRLELFDYRGRRISEYYFNTAQFILERGNLPTGVYLYRLSNQEGVIQTARLMIQ